jgi:hypothetical protein
MPAMISVYIRALIMAISLRVHSSNFYRHIVKSVGFPDQSVNQIDICFQINSIL